MDGKLLVYRKDAPKNPYISSPENTGFEKYYYAFENQAGIYDTDSLEDVFSTVEALWPNYLSSMMRREEDGSHLSDILEFVALQRSRVPATRDVWEYMHTDSLGAIARFMQSQGALPEAPPRSKDILDRVNFSINPESSLEAIARGLSACEKLFNTLNFSILFNQTSIPFLTSDNPVIWYDPTVADSSLKPYQIDLDGPIELLFPLSPEAILFGSNQPQKELLHYGEVKATSIAMRMNRLLIRFAYNTVFARDDQHQKLIEQHADESPTIRTTSIPSIRGQYIVGEAVFAKRRQKVKWEE